jgi:hypothetical protein
MEGYFNHHVSCYGHFGAFKRFQFVAEELILGKNVFELIHTIGRHHERLVSQIAANTRKYPLLEELLLNQTHNECCGYAYARKQHMIQTLS